MFDFPEEPYGLTADRLDLMTRLKGLSAGHGGFRMEAAAHASSSHMPAPRLLRGVAAALAVMVTLPLMFAAADVQAMGAERGTTLPDPDWVALLSDYERYYWQAPTDSRHGGKVLDADTMRHDEDLALAINHAGAEHLDADGLNIQRKRALIDSDLYGDETMPDALGPVLGRYMAEGFQQGRLKRVSELFQFNVASTYASKRAAMHPRPYLDRSESTLGGTNDLAGLPATLNVRQSPSWLEHVPGYSTLQKNSSFPSGHTTAAYSWGIALAGMIPELAPQIMARASEAGNNRIVLGVHYPLDVIGGRVGASAQNGQYWHNEFNNVIVPAARQLRDYLTARCREDGHGDTLTQCIADVDATGEGTATPDGSPFGATAIGLGGNGAKRGGYVNDFIDPVATEPVKDQASALRVTTARMTYGFVQRSGESGKEFTAPAGAADVLRLAYPQLHADQRQAILRITALDSGYPLWRSSKGWARINWAKALCARVALDERGDVALVELPDGTALNADGKALNAGHVARLAQSLGIRTGMDGNGVFGPAVLNGRYADQGNHPASDHAAGEWSEAAPGPDLTMMHDVERMSLLAVGIAMTCAVLIGSGIAVGRASRRGIGSER